MLRDEIDSLAPTRDFSRRDFVQTTVGVGFAASVMPVTAQTITTDTAGLTAGPMHDHRRRLQDAGLPRPARGQDQAAGDPRRVGDLRRARAHRRYRASLREAGLPRDRAGVVRAPGRREGLHRHPEAGQRGRGQGAGRAGAGRPRRRGRVGQGQRRGHRQARHHRLLLGRAHGVDVRGPQPGREGRRRVVRPDGALLPPGRQVAAGRGRQHQGRDARPVRRRRHRHPGRHGREDARCGEGRGQPEGRGRDLSRHATRLPCRLPPELPQGSRRGRLEALRRLVQNEHAEPLGQNDGPRAARPFFFPLP